MREHWRAHVSHVEAEGRATRWRDLLAPGEPVIPFGPGFAVWIGPHPVTWMSPDAYHAVYGRSWVAAPHPCGELALLHLLAADLERMRTMLEQARRRVIPHVANGHEALLIEPDARDGVAFLVQQQPIAVWLHERTARTGEQLTMAA